MATLEDAAEELVVKLRGLDSEIEESERQLEDLHQRVDHVRADVDHDWTALTEAVTAFLHKLGQEESELAQQVQTTGQAVADAQQAMAEDGAQARVEIAQGHAQLDALGQHATGLQPGVQSLATEAGEAPAKALAEQAHALEQELQQLVEDARTFVHDEVLPAITQVAADFHEQCQELHRQMAEEITAALQETFGEWESKVEQAEQYVGTHAFQASHPHARDSVASALGECKTASAQQLDSLQQLIGLLTGQLQQFGAEAHGASQALVAQASAEMLQQLDQVRAASAQAVTALDAVKGQLAGYGFVAL
jgi:hypothetical protein